jgi:hypothetical protein
MPESEKDFWKHWKIFGSDILQRLKQPFAHPPFVLYFLVVIVGVGGIGVWIEIYKTFTKRTDESIISVPRSLSTYLLAILATAAADLILSILETKRSMLMLALSSLIAGIVLAVIGLTITTLMWASSCAVLGTILALLLWLLANADNAKLFESSPPIDAATGGNPEEIAGNTDGIIT